MKFKKSRLSIIADSVFKNDLVGYLLLASLYIVINLLLALAVLFIWNKLMAGSSISFLVALLVVMLISRGFLIVLRLMIRD